MSVSSPLVMSMYLDEVLNELNKQKKERASQLHDFEMQPLSTSQKKESVSKIIVVGKTVPEVTEKKKRRLPVNVTRSGYSAHSDDFDISKQACSYETYVGSYSDNWLLKQGK